MGRSLSSIACAICGQPVDLTLCKIDENGKAVHGDSVVAKIGTTKTRILQFENIEMEMPEIHAHCSQCNREFSGTPKPNERLDDLLLRMRAEFHTHECTL